MANDIYFAKFAKVFSHQNFALYGITAIMYRQSFILGSIIHIDGFSYRMWHYKTKST